MNKWSLDIECGMCVCVCVWVCLRFIGYLCVYTHTHTRTYTCVCVCGGGCHRKKEASRWSNDNKLHILFLFCISVICLFNVTNLLRMRQCLKQQDSAIRVRGLIFQLVFAAIPAAYKAIHCLSFGTTHHLRRLFGFLRARN